MKNSTHKNKRDTKNLNAFLAGLLFLAGTLLGGLVGAGVMLLMAPQSGKKTRKQLWRKGRNLRQQTAETIEGSVNQVREKAHEVTSSLHKQAEALQQRGQDVLDQQRERWSPVVDATQTAVQGD